MIKKISLAMLLVLCEAALASFGHPTIPPFREDTQSSLAANKTLTLPGQTFGLSDPIQLQMQYSKNYGVFLVGRYALPFSSQTAGALELDYGAKERRFNATWGYALTPYQRFKLSAEHFAQDMEFDFQSGAIQHWIGQNAIGGTYEFLFASKKIHGIQLNAYASHANSTALTKVVMQNGDTDLRHIAGANAKGGSIKINLTPYATHRLGLELDYDRVRYPMLNENPALYNSSGFGGTVTFEQLLSRRTKLDLSLSHREIYNNYELALHHLIHFAPGTQLEIGLVGSRLMNHNDILNDSRIRFDMTYSWGGQIKRVRSEPAYSLENDLAQSDIVAWVQKPAVRMEQVLAIKDEAIIKGQLPVLTIYPEPSPVWKIGDFVDQKIADTDSVSSSMSVAFNPQAYQPYGLELIEKNKTDHHDEIWIRGLVSHSTSQPESTDISATNSSGTVHNPFILNLGTVKEPTVTIHSEPASPWQIGQPVNYKLADIDSTDAPLISVTYSPDVFKTYGLSLGEQNKTANHDEIWITGKVTKATTSTQSTSITAINSGGTAQGTFDLTLGDGTKPVVTIHAEPTPPWAVGKDLDEKIADIDSTSSLASVSFASDAFKDYGLTLSAKNKSDLHDEIWLSGKPSKATQAPQQTRISATNDAGSAEGDFSLTLDDVQKPTVIIHNPSSAWIQGQAIASFVLAEIHPGSGTIKTVTFDQHAYDSYGLTLSEDSTTHAISISGTPTQPTPIEGGAPITITATNSFDKTSDPATFVLHVDALKPVVTIHNPATPWKVGEAISSFEFATVDPKSGTISKVTYNKDAFSDYGLTISEDSKTHALSVSGTPTKETPSAGVALTITATNSFQKDSDSSTFTLQVLPKTKTTAVLTCPLPGTPFQVQPGGASIDVKDDHQNSYHFVYEGGGVGAGDQVGSVDSANYEPQGAPKTFRCFIYLKGKPNDIAMDAVPVPSMPADNIKFKGDNPKQCLTGSAQASQNCPLQYDY